MTALIDFRSGSELTPQADLVEAMERLSEDVRSGYVTALAVATVMSDGATGHLIVAGIQEVAVQASTAMLFHLVMSKT